MDLTLLTFNIRYDIGQDGPNAWTVRWPLILELLRHRDADIVAFQEVLPHQRQALESALTAYRFIGRGRETDGGGEQCTLAVKDGIEILDENTFWLSPTPDIPGSIGWDAMLTRICTWAWLRHQGQEFSIFNAHFDHHGSAAPKEGAALILNRTKTLDHPYCLVGDFNSVPSSEAMGLLRTQLRDSLTACDPESPAGTYHEFGSLKRPTRIDYLMMSPEWKILECRVLSQSEGPFSSDHFPVFGRYRL